MVKQHLIALTHEMIDLKTKKIKNNEGFSPKFMSNLKLNRKKLVFTVIFNFLSFPSKI